MSQKPGRIKYAAESVCVNRPCRVPTNAEARLALARDLARCVHGVGETKALRILHVPLMDVALDGLAGMAIAESHDWRRAA